jgi:hypothetical protein
LSLFPFHIFHPNYIDRYFPSPWYIYAPRAMYLHSPIFEPTFLAELAGVALWADALPVVAGPVVAAVRHLALVVSGREKTIASRTMRRGPPTYGGLFIGSNPPPPRGNYVSLSRDMRRIFAPHVPVLLLLSRFAFIFPLSASIF